MFSRLLVTSLSALALCSSAATAAPSGPWAKYNGQFKADALFRDASGGYLDEVKSIVQGGGDVNWQRNDGRTPLMSAADAGHANIVEFMLSQGADPSLRDNNGKTALDFARAAGARDVVRLLENAMKATGTAGTGATAAAPVAPAPAARPVPAAAPPAPKAALVAVAAPAGTAAPTRWAPFGTYTPGQRVQFYLPTGWRLGTVQEVGTNPTGAKYPAVYEKKYRIASDKFPDRPDWADWGTVAGVERAPFWTAFFVGDWTTGEVMAVNTRVEGRYEVSEYSYHAATEALRINADGTYLWKPLGSAEIRGKWKAASDGPGVVLMNGYRKLDWTLRNETNATEETIRRIETARLYADGHTSITAKRPLAAAQRAR